MRSLLTNAAIFLALGLCLADPSLSKEGKNNQSSSADGVESNQPDKISTDHLISTSNNDTNENKFGKSNKQENDFSVDSSAVDYEIGEDTSRSSMTAIEMGSVKPDESESSSDSTILDSVATSNDSQVDSSSKTDSNEDDSDNVTSQAKSTTLSSPSPLATESEALEMLLNFLKESVGKMLKSALPTIVQTGMEANVSAQCANSFMVLTDGLQQGKDWAFRMLDSSGKPPSGILEGTLTDFGSFEQCIDLKVPSNDVKSSGERDYLEGRYCVMDIKAALDENIDVARRPSNIPEDSVVWGRALREFWSRNSLLSFRYGLCIPSACHKEEITEIANYLAEPTGMEVNVNYCQTFQRNPNGNHGLGYNWNHP